jgi:hypothetical protein
MLATDGSYLCTGSTTGLTVYSTSGQTILTHAGDYHAAVPFAAPGQVQIALGAAGANVVETPTVPSGTSTVSAPFNGAFFSWFVDGGRFLTNVANTVYTYSNAGKQQAVVTFPKISNLTGQGNWIWIAGQGGASGPNADDLQVYAIGSNPPALDLNLDANWYLASGVLIAVPQLDTNGMTIVDLSGSSPVATSYKAFGILVGNTFASASSSQWLIDAGGSIVDGATVSAPEVRTLGYGYVSSIAATPNLVALAASNGQILLMDPSGPTLKSTIDLQAIELQFSSDGSVLGAGLNFYSLPSLSVISNLSFPDATHFNLSGSGKIIAIDNPLQVMGISGTPVIWSETNPDDQNPTPALSPDGTLFSVVTLNSPAPPTSNIYQNGTLVGAAPGYAAGWIDDGHIFVQNWTYSGKGPIFTNIGIYSPSGTELTSYPANTIPAINNPQFLPGNLVFGLGPPPNSAISIPSVYSLTDGSLVWQAPPVASNLSDGASAVSGSNVVVQVGHQVLLYPY